jgi:hypothetical protein
MPEVSVWYTIWNTAGMKRWKVILHKNETLLLLLCFYCCKQIDYFYSCILCLGGGMQVTLSVG